MTVNFKAGHVDSCVLIADINGKSYSINVALPDIAATMEMIKDTFEEECSRVYISGFDQVEKGTNLTQESVIKRIRNNREIEKKLEKHYY